MATSVDDRLALIALLVFALVFQAAWLFTTAPASEREVLARRLNASVVPAWERSVPIAFSVLRHRRYSRFPWLDALLARFDVADGLSGQLLRAGLPIRAGEFLFLQLVAVTLAGLVAAIAAIVVDGGLLLVPVAMVLGFVAPLVWLRWRVNARLSAFEAGLVDALDRVSSSLRAGYGLEHGLDAVARDGTGPVAEEFGQILQELNLGADLEEALARMLLRVDSEEAHLLATAVSVQRRTGGNLVEVLNQMSAVIRERQRLKREIRVMTTAPRVSGYVVALLPVVTLAAMFLTSRYYVDTLIQEPVGRLAGVVGGALVLVGLFLNHRIAQVDV